MTGTTTIKTRILVHVLETYCKENKLVRSFVLSNKISLEAVIKEVTEFTQPSLWQSFEVNRSSQVSTGSSQLESISLGEFSTSSHSQSHGALNLVDL